MTGVTGARPGATQLPFPISDQVSARVDVATGNLLVSTSSLSLVGVNGPVKVGQSYNSLGTSVGSTSVVAANKWTVGVDGAGYLTSGASGVVVYVAGDGGTWSFTPVAGSSTAYTAPAGIKADLVAGGGGWTLTFRQSQQKVVFNGNGQPTSIADRNGNATTIAYTGANPTSITSSGGPVAARTATLSYSASTYTLTASQASGSSSRQLQYVKNSASNLTSIVDANGKTTSFGYTGTNLTTITSPSGSVMTITYNTTTGKVEKVAQTNTTSGSPGTSTTRISYPSATQTLVAGPNTDQAQPITSVPRTTYTIDAAARLATAAVDAAGRSRSATYTPNGDIASSTDGAGAGSGTTTSTFGANGGDSKTGQSDPGGASSAAAYGNTAAATSYLASSSTDDAGNSSTFTYNGAGNQLTSTDALTNVATLTYNADGTVATALAPGNGTNKTLYGYNATTKQLTSMTPVTGAGLGARAFTYDDFGRLRTATNGRGITTTYSYDKQDRLLTTSFSDGTGTVTNTYTDTGLTKTRADANGTTTFGYDQLGRLTSRVNTFAGGTISYGYDRAGNLTTTTDSRGTTTNAFDASGVPTQITYVKGAGTQVLGFATDNRGRRTDSWLQTNAAHTTWKAHSHQDYDTSGRVSRVIGETMDSGTIAKILDVSYCYNTATAAPTCSTGTTTDRKKLQWELNNLTGQVTAYSYDTAGRLTGAAQSGGSGPNSTYAYTYDARGNRLTAVVSGASPSSQTFTVNAANQITSTGYSYDGTGNLTADTGGSYAYNGAEQMTTVTQASASYTYKYAGASQNEVIQQDKAGASYKLVYGRTAATGEPVVEQVKVGSDTAYIENDPVTGQPLLLQASSGVQSLYVYSGTGSPVAALTDYSYAAYAYKFDPYGVPTVTTNTGGNGYVQNPFVFSGGIQDRATGWIHYGARWYNPNVGRWTQQDTLDAPLEPANANRYAYAGGDPINAIDPTGNITQSQACSLTLVGVGLALGALAAGATAGLGAAAIVSASAAGAIGAGADIGIAAGIGVFSTFVC
ncbi:RHS repeat-associated core domain-containing protein [Schumannella sp. 10F1B-5-1]|uniref:RHS repeat-associated core domain-containing protein n=1 Tax=Schumannella sp. 10F1B-5-1 TaxID=2590780 RepID=UPI0015E83F59|nr:RHS repeat-associated core domain-containing protein [Schumannella sp. 10F1B-5-1]